MCLQACGVFHRGVQAYAARDLDEALKCFQHAESAGHDPDSCASARWMCWMLLGDFESAWRESDAIESRGAHDPNQFWDGTNLTGKCVMVRCLHGLGDAIQYARYLPLLRHQASHLIVEAPPDLVCLFEPLDSIDEVITWGEAAPESQPHWEAQIEITELPRYFRSTSDNLPCNVPYLFVPEHLVTLSQDRLGASASMRTGLLWQSSSWNPARSLLLEELTPILACPSFSC